MSELTNDYLRLASKRTIFVNNSLGFESEILFAACPAHNCSAIIAVNRYATVIFQHLFFCI